MRYVFIFILLLTTSQTFSQDYEKYVDDLNDIINKVPTKIFVSEDCEEMIKDLNTLSDDIGKVLDDNDKLSSEDNKNLKLTKKDAEALEAFLRTAGSSSYVAGYLKENELSRVKELLNFSIAEIYKGKFCVNIYEIRLDSYICLVAFKKGTNNILTLKAQIKSNNGLSTSKTDMGLIENKYRRIWSNADQLSSHSYQITNIECVKEN